MNESKPMEDWIAAYLEWANSDGRTADLRGSGGGAAIEAYPPSDTFVAAYLDWIDEQFAPAPPGARQARVAMETGGELSTLREAVLLDALRTESDCIHMLRQLIDVGGASAATLRFAIETVERADRLLDDERRAWEVLRALRQFEPGGTGTTSKRDAEDNWSHALDGVVADMHSLTGQIVLGLQAH